MDPVKPTTHVHHPKHGDLVVVAAPAPAASKVAEGNERLYGPGTWTVTLAAHIRAIAEMDEGGKAQVAGDEFRWVPWRELNEKEQPV